MATSFEGDIEIVEITKDFKGLKKVAQTNIQTADIKSNIAYTAKTFKTKAEAGLFLVGTESMEILRLKFDAASNSID